MDHSDSLRWLRVVPDPSQVLVARRLHRRLGPDHALMGISATVNRGQCLTVIGPAGSGKSALLAVFAGLDEPDSGSVSVAGHVMSYQSKIRRSALRTTTIGLLQQKRHPAARPDGRAEHRLRPASDQPPGLSGPERTAGRGGPGRARQRPAGGVVGGRAHPGPAGRRAGQRPAAAARRRPRGGPRTGRRAGDPRPAAGPGRPGRGRGDHRAQRTPRGVRGPTCCASARHCTW